MWIKCGCYLIVMFADFVVFSVFLLQISSAFNVFSICASVSMVLAQTTLRFKQLNTF